jgi:hypothetical protein
LTLRAIWLRCGIPRLRSQRKHGCLLRGLGVPIEAGEWPEIVRLVWRVVSHVLCARECRACVLT